MTESEKIDYLYGKSNMETKCVFCDHNLDIRCAMRHYDLFNKIHINDDCPDFELREDDTTEDENIENIHPEKDCPLCGNEARWNDSAQAYICTNDECQHKFN